MLNYYDWDSDCGDCEGSLIVTRGGALLNILCVEGGGRGRGGQGGVVRVPGKLIRLAPRRPRIRAQAPATLSLLHRHKLGLGPARHHRHPPT